MLNKANNLFLALFFNSNYLYLEAEWNSDSSNSTKCTSFKSDEIFDISKKSNKSLSRKYDPRPHIGTLEEAPEFMKKSNYILNGYRINFTNAKIAVRSLFMLHNETTNIWSHLSGVFIYMFLIFYIAFWTATSNDANLNDNETIAGLPVWFINKANKFLCDYILWIPKDVIGTPEISKIPLYIHMTGNIIWMSLSSLYHLFSWHSKEVNCKLYKYDYTGVSIMIACSIYPPYVYGFQCPQMIHFAYIYTSIINISSILLVIVCIHPKFDNEKLRWLRTVLYWVVGLAWGIPGFHTTFFGDVILHSYANCFLWALGGFFFVFGAYVYFKRFPEKKYPGKYDYFGQSHNIWHFFVLLGGITHFFASLSGYYGRRIHVCPA